MVYLSLHIGFMVAAVLTKLGAVGVAFLARGKKWWVKVHRILNYSSAGAVLAGMVLGMILTERFGEFDEGVAHRALGFLAIGAALALLLLGRALFSPRLRGRLVAWKALHRWAGRIELLLLFVVVGLGLILARAMGF